MSLLSDNLEVLYDRHPQLAERRLQERPPPGGWRVVASRCGAPTVLLHGKSLHSRYDPLREARRLAGSRLAEAQETPCTAIIVYGFGLGYLAEAFHELQPDLPMIVVESSADAFAAALRQRDLRPLLGLPGLRWHVGDPPEAVLMSVDGLPLGGVRIVRLRSAVEADPDYYRRMDALLQGLLDKREVNVNTLQRFGRLWVRNLLANLESFVAHPGISDLAGAFAGVPALVLAAGPSLEELLPDLRALRERMLVVAVDTSLRFCLRLGFEPDLLVSVDPQYWNTRHLDWLPMRRSILVCESAVNPRLFHRLAEQELPVYFVSSFFPLGQLLERIIGEKGAVGAGGSVSTTAWDVARLTGASPIYLGGLDLGFPGGRTHARGAFFEEALHTGSHRLRPAEQGIAAYLREAGAVALEDNSGGRVLTDRRMLIYKAWFEDQLKQQVASGARALSYNLASRGLRVEGLAVAEAGELLRLPALRPALEKSLDAARARGARRAGAAELTASLVHGLNALAEELQTVTGVADRGESVCARLLEEAASGRSGRSRRALLAELDLVDRDLLKASSREIAAFLLQPLIRRILDGAGRQGKYEQILELSRNLYGQMAASTRYHTRLLHRAAARLQAPRRA